MASNSIRPKLLNNLRRLNSAAPSLTAAPHLNFLEKPEDFPPKPTLTTTTTTSPVLSFDDPKELFSSLSTSKLINSAFILQMSAIGPMVDFGTMVMNSKVMEVPMLRKIVLKVIEHSFYEHFVAGKDLDDANRTVDRLWAGGIRTMLDFGSEHTEDNASCDRNMEEFVRTIESTKYRLDSPVSFVVVKITAICPPTLLKRVSDLLRWEYKVKSFNLPWKRETFELFSDSSPFYHTLTRPEPLSLSEEHELELAYERFTKICNKSVEANVPLLIDAEDTSIQPAIDYFTYSGSIKYHKDDGPLLFNTIQAYLKDANERLVIAKKCADKRGVPIGVKLVRGAYMSSESQLASSLGVDSPIHNSIQNTHNCYNQCAEFMLEEIANGSGSVVLATHNIESGKLAATKASDLGIKKDTPNLQFAQLYGMAEALSFGLRNAGFRVSKYIPFGPVDEIMPYLLRRAEENRGLLSTSSIDRQLMRKEIFRRVTSPSS